MIYRGHVRGGVIVLDPPVTLPEGVEVTIEPVAQIVAPLSEEEDPSLKMIELAGPTGIPDLATNHDHYLHGHPKVEDE